MEEDPGESSFEDSIFKEIQGSKFFSGPTGLCEFYSRKCSN